MEVEWKNSWSECTQHSSETGKEVKAQKESQSNGGEQEEKQETQWGEWSKCNIDKKP